MRTISSFSKPLAAGAAAAVLFASSTASVFAAETQSEPIHIDDVQVTMQASNDRNAMPIATRIAFTNQYSAAATRVVFLLEAHGAVIDRFDDVGIFAPGVLVRHSFPETDLGADISVVVAAASFADGMKWENATVADVPALEPIAGAVSADRY
jgi:hypothetical protein